MAILYPHRQTLLITLVCTAVVGGTFWYVNRVPLAQGDYTPEVSTTDVVKGSIDTSVSTSTDWRSQFFTSRSADANASGKAPAVTTPIASQPETFTDRFGKEFFTQYMLLRQNNQIENPDAVKSVVDQTMNNFVSSAPEAPVYDQRNVTISTDTSINAAQIYANTVGSIISTYAPAQDAATIATQALEQNDESLLSSIPSIAAAYSTMLNKLLAVPVPQTFVAAHAKLINSVSGMAFISQGMSKVFSDPVQGLVALAVYEKSVTSFREALLDLGYAFSQKGMQFTARDPAFIFNTIK